MKVIGFVLSSGLHVRLLAPTLRLLQQDKNLRLVIFSLDDFYVGVHGDVESTLVALNLNLPVIRIGMKNKGSVLGNLCLAGTEGRQEFSKYFKSLGTIALLILGNDTGYLEREAIFEARRQNITTLLVQDGFIGPLRGRRLKKIWLFLSQGRLGAVPYGMGGCTNIAAFGERWAKFLAARKRKETRQVIVTGHPVLEFRGSSFPLPEKDAEVIYFCTNFLSGCKDRHAHDRQIEEIILIDSLLSHLPVSRKLRVKIHPADQPEDYSALENASIRVEKGGELMNWIRASFLCITNISSVSMACFAAGRICLMSGIQLRKKRYRTLFQLLPGPKVRNIKELEETFNLLERNEIYQEMFEYYRHEISQSIDQKEKTGAERLALLIYTLAASNPLKGI